MSAVIIGKNISVSYKVGNVKNIGFKEYIFRKIKKQLSFKEFTALSNISFTLEPGDMLGIVGSNGAGKSTLCKVVAGILSPTTGSIFVSGNVAALLELTTGFDTQMTVKNNIYLRGAILGYSKQFLDEKYPDIIAFSELEDFQEFKFIQLSSGMKARLAFSIACLIQPEILILDEVLSVGDGAFRKKSEKKMLEVIGNGATTLFVSHSIEQTRKLCNKVLWLDKGKQMAFGSTENVCDEYEKFLDIKNKK